MAEPRIVEQGAQQVAVDAIEVNGAGFHRLLA